MYYRIVFFKNGKFQKVVITDDERNIKMNWEETDIWKFTKEHRDCNIESWGSYVGKDDGYLPRGYRVYFDKKIYYFALDGHLVSVKAL